MPKPWHKVPDHPLQCPYLSLTDIDLGVTEFQFCSPWSQAPALILSQWWLAVIRDKGFLQSYHTKKIFRVSTHVWSTTQVSQFPPPALHIICLCVCTCICMLSHRTSQTKLNDITVLVTVIIISSWVLGIQCWCHAFQQHSISCHY